MSTMAIDSSRDLPGYLATLNSEGREIYDVAVMGAGPAGCSAAAALARAGRSVLLLEKAVLPRYKTCGGGLLRRTLKLLPPLPDEVVERSFNSVLLNFHGEGLQFTAARSEPLVRMTMRAGLDYHLATEARKAGARLLDGCAVRQVIAKPEGVRLVTDQATFSARFLVAADGAQSLAAKAAGWPPLRKLAPAIEWELALSPKEFALFGETARFDFGFIEVGYAWVFPKRTHLSVGILSTETGNVNLGARLGAYLQSLGIREIVGTEKHGYVIPLEPRCGKLVRNRVLLVGDAAGLVDPITAEGISHALWSGKLAAEALSVDLADVPEVGRRYEALLEKHILGDLRAGRRLAKLVYHYPRLRNWAFRRQGQRLTNFVTDVVMGERGYQAALKDPRNYLKMAGMA